MADKRDHARGASVEAEPKDRRELILQALHRCISEQGYTKTSLTDIALMANMSPSHIRYYFDGKDAILEYYLRRACDQILHGIRAIDTSDPEKWFEEFTDYFIGNPWITPKRLSVMVEIFGISVHDPALSKIKTAYDQEIRAILKDYFEKVGCADNLTPDVAADIAQALEAGQKYNAVFQKGFTPQRARAVFLAGIRHLVASPAPAK